MLLFLSGQPQNSTRRATAHHHRRRRCRRPSHAVARSSKGAKGGGCDGVVLQWAGGWWPVEWLGAEGKWGAENGARVSGSWG
ncbi:hypothetical protein ES332_A04G044800v1 [Gossypium tomentosum]|uniref:Uncharacterized protein n=1 Tax=Gossypium tomentosum TaxID=34277 RepID=A0A5D2QUV8_GOSTO|nr:hypothetical protein ES332_A04G044800v1 [Gossypium tomentosum]